MKKLFTIIALLALTFSAFAQELFKTNVTASYYADKFHGKPTSSGEAFNMYAFTAAHKTLPFNTIVRLTNLENGKSVNVRINDRGPFVADREIDVSRAAAEKLDMIKNGTAQVSIEIVQMGEGDSATTTAAAKPTAKDYKNLDPNKRWDIQLGAFAKRENADAQAQKLVDAGFKNVVFQRTSEVTRVVIKDLPTSEVYGTLTELESKGFTDFFVRERKSDSISTKNPSIPTDTIDAK